MIYNSFVELYMIDCSRYLCSLSELRIPAGGIDNVARNEKKPARIADAHVMTPIIVSEMFHARVLKANTDTQTYTHTRTQR